MTGQAPEEEMEQLTMPLTPISPLCSPTTTKPP